MTGQPDLSTAGTGVPTWMVTFADLMALMMTFFVLLYSFSRIDEEKYRSIVDSMARGFDGVQWIKRHLTESSYVGPEPGIVETRPPPILPEPNPTKESRQRETSAPSHDARLYQRLKLALQKAIGTGQVILEHQGSSVIMRFPDSVSFESGSDQPVARFIDLISQISTILQESPGRIIVSGHTDDRPIRTKRFRSNWELSTARAVSVAHILLHDGRLDRQRLEVSGYADTRPLAPNNIPANRARNRRVEIRIEFPESPRHPPRQAHPDIEPATQPPDQRQNLARKPPA